MVVRACGKRAGPSTGPGAPRCCGCPHIRPPATRGRPRTCARCAQCVPRLRRGPLGQAGAGGVRAAGRAGAGEGGGGSGSSQAGPRAALVAQIPRGRLLPARGRETSPPPAARAPAGSPPAARAPGRAHPAARPASRRGICWLCVTPALRFQSQPCLLSFSKPALGGRRRIRIRVLPLPATFPLPSQPQPRVAVGGAGAADGCIYHAGGLAKWFNPLRPAGCPRAPALPALPGGRGRGSLLAPAPVSLSLSSVCCRPEAALDGSDVPRPEATKQMSL